MSENLRQYDVVKGVEPQFPTFTKMESLRVSGTLGTIFAAAAGGIERIAGNPTIAEKVGLEAGSGMILASAATYFASDSLESAEQLAVEGRKTKAYIELIKLTTESIVGIGGAGAITGFSIFGSLRGIVFGGLISAFTAGSMYYSIGKQRIMLALKERK